MSRHTTKPTVIVRNRVGAEPPPNGSVLSASVNKWREQYNPLRNLTIARAVLLKEMMLRGEFMDPEWTFFNMERDYPTLAALIERRTSAIVELDSSIRTTETDRLPKGATEALADEQKQALRELYDGIDNLKEAIESMAMAAFRGFALVEKQDLNGDGIVDHLGITDSWNWLRDGLNGPWIWNPDLNISARTAPADRFVPMEMFLARTVPRPLDLIALPLFCKCALAEKDWAAYVEIFGIPGGVVVGPPNVPKDKEKAYEAAAKAVAAGGVGYVPNGAEWKPNNPPHSGAPFSEFLRYQHEQLVLAGTGGQLTMLAESGSGTLAGTAHQETFQKIARAEGARISADVFQRQLDKPYLERLFPGKPICAYFELDIRQSPTTKEVISDVKELAAAGYPVDPEEVSERTGYEIITKDSVDPTVPPSDPTQAQDPAAPADPQNPMPEEKPITNRKTLAESAVDLVARSVASDLQPVSDKLQSILDLNDPAAQRQGLIRFLEDMPKEAQAILSNPSSAESIANVMSTAAVNGLLNSAAKKK